MRISTRMLINFLLIKLRDSCQKVNKRHLKRIWENRFWKSKKANIDCNINGYALMDH